MVKGVYYRVGMLHLRELLKEVEGTLSDGKGRSQDFGVPICWICSVEDIDWRSSTLFSTERDQSVVYP